MNSSIGSRFKALIFVGAASLTGCDKVDLTGTAHISKDFVVSEKAASSGTVKIPSGKHRVSVSMSASKTVFNFTTQQGLVSFSSKTPRSAKSGIWQDFSFAASELKQNFSLVGKNTVKTQRGNLIERSESCVYDTVYREHCVPGYWTDARSICHPGRTSCTEEKRHCRKVPDRSDDGYRCEWEITPGRCHTEAGYCETRPREWVPERCSTSSEKIYGDRTSRGRNVTTQNILDVSIYSTAQVKLGQMNFADQENTRFVAETSGPCRR